MLFGSCHLSDTDTICQLNQLFSNSEVVMLSSLAMPINSTLKFHLIGFVIFLIIRLNKFDFENDCACHFGNFHNDPFCHCNALHCRIVVKVQFERVHIGWASVCGTF